VFRRSDPDVTLFALMAGWLILCLYIGVTVGEKYLPLPSASLSISGGAEGGYYQILAKEYAQELRARGFDAQVMDSQGSMQNMQRISLAEADASFSREGIAAHSLRGVNLENVLLIAQISQDPVWIFSRIPPFESFEEIKDKRFAIGRPGSGSELVAKDLLRIDQVDVEDLPNRVEVSGELPRLFKEGKVDVAIQVMAADAPLIQQVLAIKEVHLIDLPKAAGLGIHIPYFHLTEIKDPANRHSAAAPNKMRSMLSARTSLIARVDLHPAIQRQLADVAVKLHGETGRLNAGGGYPNQKATELNKSLAARDVLLAGLPWLESRMSPRHAYIVYRIVLIWLPLIALTYLVYYVASMLVKSSIHNRIAQLYGSIKYLEVDLRHSQLDGLQLSNAYRRIKEIDQEIAVLKKASSGLERFLILERHVSSVQTSLHKLMGR